MMKGKDMVDSPVCADNIGALLIHRDGKQVLKRKEMLFVLMFLFAYTQAWWTGSLMQSVEAQRVAGSLNNGANITVSAACLATIAWAVDNPRRGMLFPDDFSLHDSEALLERCAPFLGKMVSVAVEPRLLPPLDQPFVMCNTGILPVLQ
jgi:homospermidine synthase